MINCYTGWCFLFISSPFLNKPGLGVPGLLILNSGSCAMPYLLVAFKKGWPFGIDSQFRSGNYILHTHKSILRGLVGYHAIGETDYGGNTWAPGMS